MKAMAALIAAALIVSCSPAANAPTTVVDTSGPQGAPATPIRPVTDTYFGTTIPDPYRWLENGQDPEVRQWTAGQSARARAYLDALPYRAQLQQTLMGLISQTSPSYSGLKAAGNYVFARYNDPSKQQPMLSIMGSDLDVAHARVVVDPNTMDAQGAIAIDWFVPSPDGTKVAVSLSRGGSEDGDLHFFDAMTGHEIGEVVQNVQHATAGGDLAWSEDGQSVWYTRYPGTERPEADRNFFQTVWTHRLGSNPSTDQKVFGDGLPRVAEIQLEYSSVAHALLITVQNGDGGEFAHYVLDQDGLPHQITRFEDGVDYATFGPDGAIYMVSEKNAPRRQVLKLAAANYDLAAARTIIRQGADVIVTDFYGDDPIVFFGQRMAVRFLAGGPSKLRTYNLTGGAVANVPLPAVAAVDEMEPIANDLVYSVETYLAPRGFHRFANGRDTATALQVQSPVNFNDMEVVRVNATSRDGTRVPVNIIRRKGLALNGQNPMVLYGYGGYGLSETPAFLGASRRVFFDAGGVYAIANLRGGGEFGEEWHQQGMLTHKQNVFDDFYAAAQLLIDQHYTSPQKLAIRGGSNGGLLMGAAMTQHPEMFRAVVSSVGIYDMLRVELDPNGAFNVPEFGTVQNQQQFQALYAYSPYHHVRDRESYPAVLMQTGENDGRVNPMQSRKMAARLQAATGSERPIYLLTESAAGHGQGSPISVQVGQIADYTAFLFDQLGMQWPRPQTQAPSATH